MYCNPVYCQGQVSERDGGSGYSGVVIIDIVSQSSRTSSSSSTNTPSASSTMTPTAAVTSSTSQTPSSTPTTSSMPTGTGSVSSTQTSSVTSSHTSTSSSSATRTKTSSMTPTPTVSPSHTATASQPPCRAPVTRVAVQSGANGTFPIASSAVAGNVGMYTSGYCAGGLSTLFPGPRLVYRIALNDGAPLGGTLTLSTCGLTSNNTVLYLGTGCPTWSLPFGCLRGNDDAGDAAGQACPSNPRASTISSVATSRFFFAQLGSSSGADVVSGLSWSYVAPRPSPTSTRTRSRTTSSTRTRSATRSKSRSRKAKRAAV